MSLDIGWDDIIKASEAACIEEAQGTLQCPPKKELNPKESAAITIMPAGLFELGAFGVKWVAGFANNYEDDLPQVTGLQIMNCPKTGVPLAVMDCRWLTAVRTAAMTAISAKHCAKKDSSVIAIVGAGVQGRMNLVAVQHVMGTLTQCNLVELRDDAAADYKVEMERRTGIKVKICGDMAEAMDGADIIVTCTQRVRKPFIPAESFKPGMFGAGLESGRAWPKDALHGADKVVTDYPEQTRTFDKPEIFEGGLPKLYASVGQLITGQKKGRENDLERILVFNTGFGGVDSAMGKLIYDTAKAKGVGTWLTLMESENLF